MSRKFLIEWRIRVSSLDLGAKLAGKGKACYSPKCACLIFVFLMKNFARGLLQAAAL